MRRSVVDKIGGQKHLTHTHDLEMWLRMSAFCDVAYIHGADQAWHREHAQSLSAQYNGIRDLTERRDAFDALFVGRQEKFPKQLHSTNVLKQPSPRMLSNWPLASLT